MEPRIGIGAIQGGYPYKPSKCPAPFFYLYVDFRLVPGQSFMETKREIEAVMEGLKADDPDLRTEVHFYLMGNGYELGRDEAVVVAMEKATTLSMENRYRTQRPADTPCLAMQDRCLSTESKD